MRFYLDEGISPAVGAPLREVFRAHEFLNPDTEGLRGVADLELFARMQERQVDVFVTLDRAQLRNPAERDRIVEAGFHWIALGHGTAKGLTLISRQAATLLIAIAHILENPPSTPTAYRLKGPGMQAGQIFSHASPLAR